MNETSNACVRSLAIPLANFSAYIKRKDISRGLTL